MTNDSGTPDLRAHLDQFHREWKERLGGTGDELARDLRQLVDLLLQETEEIIDEVVARRVCSWALADSTELIPLDKISKEGLAKLMVNPEYISNGELMEILKLRFPDL